MLKVSGVAVQNCTLPFVLCVHPQMTDPSPQHTCQNCRRRQQNVDETVQALRAKGLQVSGVVCHVGDAQQRTNLIRQTMQVWQHGTWSPPSPAPRTQGS